MNERESSAVANAPKRATIVGVHGVRYQVKDVARAAAFYADHLGFKLEHQQLPAFASVSLGDFTLLLSGPGASGSRLMPGGEPQKPGGWNRVVLRVTCDLPAQIETLKNAGVESVAMRVEVVRRPTNSRLKDPDGNPSKLFERPLDQKNWHGTYGRFGMIQSRRRAFAVEATTRGSIPRRADCQATSSAIARILAPGLGRGGMARCNSRGTPGSAPGRREGPARLPLERRAPPCPFRARGPARLGLLSPEHLHDPHVRRACRRSALPS
jgi:glyoxylase I family protein